MSIYIPPRIEKNILKQKFISLITSLWEHDSKNDNSGNIIADIINNSNFIVANTGEHTYYSDRYNKSYAIDITLKHASIANEIHWENTFENLTSDHYISNNEIANNITNVMVQQQKINFKTIQQKLQDMKLDGIEDILKYEENIVKLIQDNSYTTPENNKYVPKYWWTDKISNLWHIKKHKLKLYNKYKSDFTKIELKTTSYRPISLINVLAKTFNKLVKFRVESFIAKEKIIP